MKTIEASNITEQQVSDHQLNSDELILQQVMSAWADKLVHDGNRQEADKLLELCAKERDGQLVVAMCGHFSAGKSTVINQMCGKRLLPSSPIPTSANVVSIQYGARRAEIVYRDDHNEKVQQIPLEQLEQVCRDGENIEKVHIYDDIQWLSKGAMLLDTPGVDSVDELHREATEAALHMADIVCYVTDYNHVLSEINFTFAKQVADAGKPLIWIVNQIDKHRETELPFEQYREDVRKSLQDWLIKPAAVFYVSMLEPDHPANEWPLVLLALQLLVRDRKKLVRFGIEQAARHIISQHMDKKLELIQDEYQEWVEQQGGEMVVHHARNKLSEAKEAFEVEAAQLEEIQKVYPEKLTKLLKDANITSAILRDLAQQYLESCQSGYRVGLWNRKERTEQERARRLMRFEQRWQEDMQANITVHVTSWARELVSELNESSDDVSEAIERCVSELNGDWLARYVQTGSAGSNEYTMNYCRLISEEAKSYIRKQVLNLIEPYMKKITIGADQKLSELEEDIHNWQYKLNEDDSYRKRMEQTKAELVKLMKQMDQAALRDTQSVSAAALLPDLRQEALLRLAETTSASSSSLKQQIQLIEMTDINVGALYEHEAQRKEDTMSLPQTSTDIRLRWQHAAKMLDLSAHVVEQHELFAHLSQSLRTKAQRLRNNEFSVALFGAFSAGKSSFANALMGQDLLPVSPNPTTAAINRIIAPTASQADHTALIKLKTEEMLVADLRYALECIGEKNAVKWSLTEMIQAADRWHPDMLLPSGKAHYSFIQAVKRGYDEIKSLLGTELHVSYEEYRKYVSVEAKSAFVTNVDLFAQNAWTEQGFTFVDTPGADSINARHTGVSFEYIKNADMILFVTYYNHAFSQADRQFLTQLGRVKDSFELDKMFFIVNAADLAASQDELESVLQYMRSKLQEFGIRAPRIFAVSSLRALESKMSGDTAMLSRTGFAQFEAQFQHFAAHELSDLSIQAAVQDIQHAKTHVLAMAAAARVDAQDREQQIKQLKTQTAHYVEELRQLTQWTESKRMEQELDELLYHIRQRMQYQFNDSFSLAFNPATLRAEDKYMERALNQCYGEWQRNLERELTNELLATSLRMEKLGKRLIREQLQQVVTNICEHIDGFQYQIPAAFVSWNTPKVEICHIEDEFTGRKLKSIYRSSKAFFAEGGRETLKSMLEQRALDRINLDLKSIKQVFMLHLEQSMLETMQELAHECIEMLNQHECSMVKVWSQVDGSEQYEAAVHQLEAYILEMR